MNHYASPARLRFRATAQPAGEPVTLAEALVHARVDSEEDHALLQGYLIAARQWCEAHLGRPILPTPVAAEAEAWPCGGGFLLDAPIIAVSGITYTDTDGALAAWGDYITRRQPGGAMLLRTATGASWPVLGADPVIRIEAVAGFEDDVPEPIRLAILQLAAHWFAVREPVSVGNVASEVAFTAAKLLQPYRWRLIG